jgi:hypothetical protein
MSLVNWSSFLPQRAIVTFSALRIPDQRDSLDDDIAEIVIDGWYIDVEWNDSKKLYYVTMFKDSLENCRARVPAKTPHDVIETVQRLIDELGSPVQSASAVTKESTISIIPAQHSGLALAMCR